MRKYSIFGVFFGLLLATYTGIVAAQDADRVGVYVDLGFASHGTVFALDSGYVFSDDSNTAVFGGVGIRLDGGYFFTPNMRAGGNYANATLEADIDGTSDIKVTLLTVYADYVFDSGFYLGGGIASRNAEYKHSAVTVDSATGLGLRIGGYWQPGDVVLDVSYQYTVVEADVNSNGIKVGTLDGSGMLAFGVGYNF